LTVLLAALPIGIGYVMWVQSGQPLAVADDPAPALSPEEDPAVLFSSPGVTEPKSRSLQIVSETVGTIRAIHVKAGDPVRKGQLLVELNNDLQKAGVELAEAALARTRADLERVRSWERPEERAIARAQYDEALASLHLAQFEWQRVEKMMNQNAASDKEVAAAKNALALAQARTDAAKKRWDLSEAGPRPEDLLKAEAMVRETEASLNAARATLAKTLLVSPIDGVVIYRYREPGETAMTDPPTPILSVGDRSELRVRVDVDEIDIGRLWLGQRVYVTAPAYGNKRFPGRVIHIEPTLGRKNFRTARPTERVDTKIQEAVVALDKADEVPVELQMIVWFLKTPGGGPTTRPAL
jgi:multidrug resistance efflux pump